MDKPPKKEFFMINIVTFFTLLLLLSSPLLSSPLIYMHFMYIHTSNALLLLILSDFLRSVMTDSKFNMHFMATG